MFLKICLTLLAILPSFIDAQANETRIVGGVVSPDFIPYQIALFINGFFSCGGSMLTENCVLTAGHCVKGNAAGAFKVHAGIRKLSSNGGQTRDVAQTFVPTKFNPTTLNYDVAILKLKAPLIGTNIATIPMNNVILKAGDIVKVSGWGITKESSSTVSDMLRYVFVPVITRAKCNAEYSGGIFGTMFCAGAATGGKDACSGDSGGPVVLNGRQYGIVSWGFGCARPNYAGVYTSIRQVLPWINKIKAANCM